MKTLPGKQPKILFFDIETAPNVAYVWGKYEQDVIAYQREWNILSFSAKWLNGKLVTKGLIDYPGFKRNRNDDKAIVKDIWKLFDEADVIVAHNGKQFDVKKCNARFSFHQLMPPTPYEIIDTKLEARKHFNFNSNKLDDIAKFFNIGQKVQTGGFELWLGCMAGNKSAWDKMKQYNGWDVLLLEKIYLKFLPWIKIHPNYGLFVENLVCPRCGSDKFQSRGYRTTLSGLYRRVRCTSCGGNAQLPIRERKLVKLAKSI